MTIFTKNICAAVTYSASSVCERLKPSNSKVTKWNTEKRMLTAVTLFTRGFRISAQKRSLQGRDTLSTSIESDVWHLRIVMTDERQHSKRTEEERLRHNHNYRDAVMLFLYKLRKVFESISCQLKRSLKQNHEFPNCLFQRFTTDMKSNSLKI